MEAAAVTAIISELLSVGNKLLDKTPNYDQKKKAEFLELRKNFDVYKDKPVEERVNSYLFNLKKEVMAHIEGMVDAL